MLKKKFQHKEFFSDIKVLLEEHALLRQASMLEEENQSDQTRSKAFDDDLDDRRFKRNLVTDSSNSKGHSWLNDSLISISTTGDTIVISDGFHLVALIKLRINADNDTINKYVIKPLQIKAQEDEDITSILCLPIMSSQRTGIGLVDWTAIVVGYSSGYTRFYDEQSCCLLSLRFVEDEVVNLKLQTLRQNTNSRSESHFPSLSEEFTIVHRSRAIIIDGFGLFENLTIAKKESAKSATDPAYDAMNLPCVMTCKRWKLESSGTINDCDNCGVRKRSIFDTLVSNSINQEHNSSKICGQTILTTGQSPFVACYRESNIATVHSYSDWIGSFFSMWKQKPQPSKTQMIDSSTTASLVIKDHERLGASMISSPDKRLAAITDDFGRVVLLDVTNWIAIRIWKGYRYAQCGWVEVSRDINETKCPRALFLVIYAPKRGLLEIWSTQRGPRVAAFNVGKDCLLLYNNHRMLNMRAELLVKNLYNRLVEQSYHNNCYLLNPHDDSIYTIEVPYTCSLSRDGDLKSRDNLLLNELVYALKQEEDLDHLCEILFKIALVESRTKAIQKLSTQSTLSPKILKKLMVQYEQHIFKCYKPLLSQQHKSEKDATPAEPCEPPYDLMTADDLSVVELANRVIKLCDLFMNLSYRKNEITMYTKMSKKTLARYNDHPEEIDELADKLGWTASEVARSISLLALDESFRHEFDDSPWPDLGEPLSWDEFISCFDFSIVETLSKYRKASQQKINDTRDINGPKLTLRLFRMDSQFLNTEKVIKAASLMYSKLFSAQKHDSDLDSYSYIDPATRLTLLYLFWLNSKLCNYWMTWETLQRLTGSISNELKNVSSRVGEMYLINAWKQVYTLILESGNLFAAIIATAAIKNDTLRLIRESESTDADKMPASALDEAVQNLANNSPSNDDESGRKTGIEWENLYIDAERLAMLNSQLEDVLFLSLLLNYSHKEGRLVNRHVYKVKKISVANILRGGPTLVSELVAQWAVQTMLDIRIFVETYRDIDSESGASKQKDKSNIFSQQRQDSGQDLDSQSIYSISTTRSSVTIEQADDAREDGIEQALELLHHVKSSFPNSLSPDILYINCFWEYCLMWSNNPTVNHTYILSKALDCLHLFRSTILRHKLAYIAWKTFFQRTFERLTLLVETNSALVSSKTIRMRDAVSKRELNMSEDCLDDYVKFCSDVTEMMLQTHMEAKKETMPKFKLDDWWLAPTKRTTSSRDHEHHQQDELRSPNHPHESAAHTLIYGAASVELVDAQLLVELNRLCTILYIIITLKITRAYPISLIGSEARQILRLDLQGESKLRYEPLDDLRRKFALKCVSAIAASTKLDDSQFDDQEMSSTEQEHSNYCYYYKEGQSVSSATTGTTPSAMATRQRDSDLSMIMFGHVVTLCKEWQLDCDLMHRELVLELYRCCNKDRLAEQMATRVQDQSALSRHLIKLASQRILVLVGLSPYLSSDWRKNSANWTMFQPNVCQWLKMIQQEERQRELASLSSGQVPSVEKIRAILEKITNHLDGQAERLAYNLIETLESLEEFESQQKQ